MKKKYCFIGLSIVVIGLFSSCSTTDQVVTSSLIQKRKYLKGYHLAHVFNKQKQIEDQLSNQKTLPSTQNEIPSASLEATAIKKTNKRKYAELFNSKKEAFIKKEAELLASNTNELGLTYATRPNQQMANAFMDVVSLNTKKSIVFNDIKDSRIDSYTREEKNNTGLIILAIFLPVIAVGIATKWNGKKVLINLLLTLLGWLPGVIHAIITINKS